MPRTESNSPFSCPHGLRFPQKAQFPFSNTLIPSQRKHKTHVKNLNQLNTFLPKWVNMNLLIQRLAIQ